MIHRHRASLGALLLAACFLSLTLIFAALHLAGPSDGARLEPDGPVWRSSGIVVTPLETPQATRAADGLRPGDVVVAVGGRRMEAWANLLFDPSAPRPRWRAGDVVTYTVIRGGQRISVPVALRPYPVGAMLREDGGSFGFALAFALIASFVFARRPDDRAARSLFLAAACLLSAQTWSFGLQISDLVGGLGFWLYQATALVAYTIFWASLLHFALVFPRPHPLVLRWRWLVPAIYVVPMTFWIAYLYLARVSSSDTLTWIGAWTPAQGVIGAIYFATALLMTLDTFRLSRDPITRRQIRWVVFAGALSGSAGLLLSILPGDVFGHAIISTNMLGLVLLPIPFAIAFAILRYRLFDIDIIIHRTLVYGTLTAALAFVYWVSVIALQALAGKLNGLTTEWPPAIVASTLLIAALFQPLRQRVQVGIDRRFYRHKYDSARTLATFGATLRTQTGLDDLSERLVGVVEETMQPTHISLWLAAPSKPQRAPADDARSGSAR